METPLQNEEGNYHYNTQKKKGKIADFDKMIHVMYEYITSSVHCSLYRTKFSKKQIDILKKIKRSDVKKRRFKKWYNMSRSLNKSKRRKAISSANIIDTINKSKICTSQCFESTSFMSSHSVSNDYFTNNNNTNFINSESEKGLNDFYNKNNEIFIQRVYKCPPDVFRKYGWLTCANIPINRNASFYNNILRHNLNPEIETQINKDILRTIEEQEINLPNLKAPLFRILKALALLDTELSYCQGMNFIVGFILILMEGNEVDAFYLSVSLFSQTYSDKYNIRGFYLDSFPLLNLYMFIFEYHFKNKMSKLYSKINSFEIPNHCWIGKWFQTLFVNTFSKGMVIRIWDGIIAFGIQFIISIALSIINHLESQLLGLNDLVDISNFFGSLNCQHRNKSASNNNNNKGIHFDIEEIMKKAKTKYYLSEDNMKDMIAVYFENNNIEENDGDEEEEEKINKVMNYINTKVEYDIENYETNQSIFEIINHDSDSDTDNKKRVNINITPLIKSEYCYKDNSTRIDTIYDSDINEFYFNTIECNGNKFPKPIPTKNLFKNPFVSDFNI